MPKIKIDPEKCIGCGLCESLCPEIFEMDGDKALAKRSEPSKTASEMEAIDCCPTEAIKIS